MEVLVIAPHMDDEVLGVGGTVARHVHLGDRVTVCIVANRAYNHTYDAEKIDREKSAARKAQEVLGYQNLHFLDLPDERLDHRQQEIIIPLEKLYNQLMPNVAYVNHGGDLNQDHQAVFGAAMIVCRPHASHKLDALYCYETPSSTDQAPALPAYAFQPTHYVGIENYLEQKLTAVDCYETESRSFPHPRSREGITVYAKKRGSEIGLPAAEAFILLRNVVA